MEYSTLVKKNTIYLRLILMKNSISEAKRQENLESFSFSFFFFLLIMQKKEVVVYAQFIIKTIILKIVLMWKKQSGENC